jgi:hypothetical protein
MRLTVLGLLAFVSAGVLSVALADPPGNIAQQPPAAASAQNANAAQTPDSAAATTAPPAATTAPTATAPAAATAPAPSAARSATPAAAPSATPAAAPSAALQADAEEKRLMSQGYKPRMHNGEKEYCRREQTMGSHFTDEHCGTLEQLRSLQQNSRDVTEKVQRTQINPRGG